jgi:putative phosphoesterase
MEKAGALLFSPVPAEKVVACVGLISDTHMPERCAVFPASTFEVLQGVDLILHAGDVGELWVLDHLSAIAPVVAVHGNDDTWAAQRELPYQQLVSIAGQRALLWHSHYSDPAEDKARRGASWHAILSRRAERGRAAGAKVVVFGHAHVPMVYRTDDVLLVNPGALASGNLFTRQTRQTVGLLFVCDDGALAVAHVDLAAPERAFAPDIDWEAGFEAALARFQSWIVEPGLVEDIGRLSWQAFKDVEALKAALLPLCHRCWAGEKEHLTRAELLDAIEHHAEIPPGDREKAVAVLTGH